MADLIEITADAEVVARQRRDAAVCGLPLELAVYIAIEAQRAVDEAVSVFMVGREDLVAALDTAAAAQEGRDVQHLLARPLCEYARALEAGLDDPDVDGPLRARAPHRVAAAWAHAAAAAAIPVDRWLADTLARAIGSRARWEAAAARSGRTLSEWVLLQAARRSRSRSTSPQSAASG